MSMSVCVRREAVAEHTREKKILNRSELERGREGSTHEGGGFGFIGIQFCSCDIVLKCKTSSSGCSHVFARCQYLYPGSMCGIYRGLTGLKLQTLQGEASSASLHPALNIPSFSRDA